jgi:hypothetical protein
MTDFLSDLAVIARSLLKVTAVNTPVGYSLTRGTDSSDSFSNIIDTLLDTLSDLIGDIPLIGDITTAISNLWDPEETIFTNILTFIKTPSNLINDIIRKAIIYLFDDLLGLSTSEATGVDFNVEFDSTTGLGWLPIKILEEMIDYLYEAVQDFLEESEFEIENPSITLYSGLTLILDIDFRIDFKYKIKTITFSELKFTMPNIDISGPFDLLKYLLEQVFTLDLEYVIPDSEDWYFTRNGETEPHLGTWYDPNETYKLSRDFFQKDFLVFVFIGLIIWALTNVGLHQVTDKFIQVVTKAKNFTVSHNLSQILNIVRAIHTVLDDDGDIKVILQNIINAIGLKLKL